AMQLRPGDVPGMTFASVHEIALPGILETSGQISFDDRRVSTIISRVTGRIEDIRVSLWDNVRKGEAIATLYSPDYMTAEAVYLQSLDNLRLGPSPELPDAAQMQKSMMAAAQRKLELLGLTAAEIKALRTPAPTTLM